MVKRLRRKALCRSGWFDRFVGKNNSQNHKFACHSIRRSSNPKKIPRFPCFPWTKK